MIALPIDRFIDDIVDRVRRSRALVLTADPGAGKTTRVPPALLEHGPVILLQPRRVAARAMASRIAEERGWTIGREVGWQVRHDRQFGPQTNLLVVTEGVLSARLQTDPLLSLFRTIVIDEFHERSIHADLALTLSKQAWLARDDLRIVVMSATLQIEPVSAFLDGCPVLHVPGRVHPIDIAYAPAQPVPDAALELFDRTDGSVLCFLPGAREIQQSLDRLASKIHGRDVDLLPLHGSLDAAQQDRAIRPSARRRIVVSTNVAETSLTVAGVSAVVDSGQQKVARYDAARGIDSLELERITADAADQRAGRAGRTGPGCVRRLWDARDRLRPHREAEIRRIDLSAAVLGIIAWGGDPRTIDWFERPREEALDAALVLLGRLGLVTDDGKLTDLGGLASRLPLHPRLARMLIESRGMPEMSRACAMLAERYHVPPRTASTSSDLFFEGGRELGAISAYHFSAQKLPPAPDPPDVVFRRAVLAGYPDRVAQRREPQSPRLRLASGAGARLGAESGVTEGEFLVAVDVQMPATQPHRPQATQEAIVRIASRVDREWLVPNNSELVHRFESDSGAVKAVLIERYDALVLGERPAAPDREVVARMLAAEWHRRGPRDADRRLLSRLRFAGHDVSLDDLVHRAAQSAQSLGDMELRRGISGNVLRSLDRDAPEDIVVPSGRAIRLDYGDDGSVSASVKLQELFGLAETPRVGPRGEPIVFALLAPNGRPVQLTRDLRSFWNRTYPEVRRELRGRYPKHPWPDDPWSATPTARTKRR